MEVYVVTDYDCVDYAGLSLDDAKDLVRGSGHINVWVDGKITHQYTLVFQKGWVKSPY